MPCSASVLAGSHDSGTQVQLLACRTARWGKKCEIHRTEGAAWGGLGEVSWEGSGRWALQDARPLARVGECLPGMRDSVCEGAWAVRLGAVLSSSMQRASSLCG